MDKYYHFTNEKNFYSIMENGLIPQMGIRCQSIGDDRSGVFLSKGIIGTITMFASMLSFYEKYKGLAGDMLIEENSFEINKKLQQNFYGNDQMFDDKIIALNDEIQRVNLIRSYNTFHDYLGGAGCFLSINSLIVDESYPENCCYKDAISTSEINVINIKKKNTEEYIYLREPVLAYFMYQYPFEMIINYVPTDYINSVRNLYMKRDIYAPLNYNPEEYELVEVPMDTYKKSNNEIKTLTI